MIDAVIADAIFEATGINLAEDGIEEVKAKIAAAGYAIVPIKPTDGLLSSMAMRWDHSFGMDRIETIPGFAMGYTPEMRQSLMGSMAQLHEEVVGTGFYRPDLEDRYVNVAKKGGNP